MSEFDRLSGGSEWIDLEFVERERTPGQIIEVGIHTVGYSRVKDPDTPCCRKSSRTYSRRYQLHLAGLSLSNTKQYIEKLGVERSRTAIHDWVQRADLQPSGDGAPNQIALDETVIRVNDERYRLYATVDPETNEFLHIRLFRTRTTRLTVLFLRELRDKQQIEQATFLVDGAYHLSAELERLGFRFRTIRHGSRNAVECVLEK